MQVTRMNSSILVLISMVWILFTSRASYTQPYQLPPRTIGFPADKSMGTLQMRKWTESRLDLLLSLPSVSGEFRSEPAQGSVRVPAGWIAELHFRPQERSQSGYLRGLQANDLQALSCFEPLTDRDIIEISSLRGLWYLNLNCGNVSEDGFGSLKDLTELRVIALDAPLLNDIHFVAFEGMKSLEKLTILKSRVKGGALAQLPHGNLEFLALAGQGLTDLACDQAKSLTRLEELVLLGGTISDQGITSLQQLPKLRQLSVKSELISDIGIGSMSSIRTLSSLTIFSPLVSDQGLSLLGTSMNLRQLRIASPRISDDGIADLATTLSQLETFEFAGSRLSENIVPRIRRILPKCAVRLLEY